MAQGCAEGAAMGHGDLAHHECEKVQECRGELRDGLGHSLLSTHPLLQPYRTHAHCPLASNNCLATAHLTPFLFLQHTHAQSLQQAVGLALDTPLEASMAWQMLTSLTFIPSRTSAHAQSLQQAVGLALDTPLEASMAWQTLTSLTFIPSHTSAHAQGLQQAVGLAVMTYRHHNNDFQALQRRGMTRDASWDLAAQQYEQVFEWALIDTPYCK